VCLLLLGLPQVLKGSCILIGHTSSASSLTHVLVNGGVDALSGAVALRVRFGVPRPHGTRQPLRGADGIPAGRGSCEQACKHSARGRRRIAERIGM
jgi:hypothetical protein